MSKLAKNRVAYSVVISALILIFAAVAIFWARGFKPNFKNGSIERTGLIVATSVPTGAQVYLDDRLTSATNTNIAFLDPKTYKVRIEKDGYTTWEKEIEIKADLATEIKALLFPLAPEIKPLTTTGASNPTLSPDGSKIVYGVSGERGGLYTVSMSDRPFPFRQDVRLLAKNRPGFDFSKAKFVWSPDSKELIARLTNQEGQEVANILIDSDKSEQDFRDITGSLNATLISYQQEFVNKSQTLAISAPEEVKNATREAKTSSPKPSPKLQEVQPQQPEVNYYPTGLIFSPDEEKILYENKDGKYKIYDQKAKKEYTLPDFADFITIAWYPDSEHLVLAQKNLISIMEKDGANRMTVYSGKFENGFVFAHPSGQRLIILTTLTQPEGNPPNLYSINLR